MCENDTHRYTKQYIHIKDSNNFVTTNNIINNNQYLVWLNLLWTLLLLLCLT